MEWNGMEWGIYGTLQIFDSSVESYSRCFKHKQIEELSNWRSFSVLLRGKARIGSRTSANQQISAVHHFSSCKIHPSHDLKKICARFYHKIAQTAVGTSPIQHVFKRVPLGQTSNAVLPRDFQGPGRWIGQS